MQLLFFVISFMQGIYIYIPETNVFRSNSVAAILQSQLVTDIMLFHTLYLSYSYISTFQSKCAVPSMAVFLDFVLSRHVGDGSVGLHVFIPQYGYLNLHDLFLLLSVHADTIVLCLIYTSFLAHVEV